MKLTERHSAFDKNLKARDLRVALALLFQMLKYALWKENFSRLVFAAVCWQSNSDDLTLYAQRK